MIRRSLCQLSAIILPLQLLSGCVPDYSRLGSGGSSGTSNPTGGTSSGGTSNPTGGTSNPTGGTSNGGTSSGGTSNPTGGTSSGGTSNPTGGTSSGGTSNPTGGTSSGGTSNPTGGSSSGGALPSTTVTCGHPKILVGSTCTALVSGLEVDGGTLSAAFDPAVTTYASTVSAAATTVTVKSSVPGVDITINDVGISALKVNLTTPITMVNIVAKSGTATVTYRLAIAQLGAQLAYIKASNTGADDWFGHVSAISEDGSTLAIGAPHEDGGVLGTLAANDIGNRITDSGAVYVFTQRDGVWSQQACLKASNPEVSDIFGYSIALSADGNTLAVGASWEDSDATISGTNPRADGDNEKAIDSGAAYVFTRSDGDWTQEALLKASNAEAGDLLGHSIALSSDGNTLVVTAVLEDSPASVHGKNPTANDDDNPDEATLPTQDSGSAYVFARKSDGWQQQAILKASNAELGDRFGQLREIGISGDGTVVALASNDERSDANVSTTITGLSPTAETDNSNTINSGAIQIFRLVKGTWRQEALLKASNAETYDYFGYSIALSKDGLTLAVGAPYEDSAVAAMGTMPSVESDDNQEQNSGAVYVFTYSGTAWSQQDLLKASNAENGDLFGHSVALSPDGKTLIATAEFEDSDMSVSGSNPLTDGDQANRTSATRESGAAYVFTFNGNHWVQKMCLKATNAGADDNLGSFVNMSTNSILVGVPLENSATTGINGNAANDGAQDSGAAYLFAY